MHFRLNSLFLLLAVFVVRTFALFKLVADAGGRVPLLVENADPRTVYLFQFPRTATVPSQAALNLEIETWLHWNRGAIKFHRLSNLFFLGSQSNGAAPYVQFNGAYIDGAEDIVSRLTETFRNELDYKNDNEEERQLRSKINDEFFKLLMFDRVKSLSFMRSDEGIVEQMIPLLLRNSTQTVELGDRNYQIWLNETSWRAYFDMYSGTTRGAKSTFLRDYLVPAEGQVARKVEEQDWEPFNEWMRREVIELTLSGTFERTLSNGQPNPNVANSQQRLAELLQDERNLLKSQLEEGKAQPYFSYSSRQIVRELQVRLANVKGQLARHGGKQLFEKRTPADAALFGVLVQFFETPMHIVALQKTFGQEFDPAAKDGTESMETEDETKGVLFEFVQHVKQGLGLGGQKWTELTERPWTLNYDAPFDATEQKYSGPFAFDGGDLGELPQLEVGGSGVRVKEESAPVLGALPAEVQNAIRALIDRANASPDAGKAHVPRLKFAQASLAVMTSYLCGTANCANTHLEKAADLIGYHGQDHRGAVEVFKGMRNGTRRIVHDSIVAYNEGLVRGNVLGAVARATAAGAVSPIWVGNEF